MGVPEGFLTDLLDEDDWSYVIKLHAFIEAVATRTIVEHLQEPGLADFVARSGLQFGKLRMLSDLGLTGREVRRFVASLSKLRNALVHDVQNVQFDMAKHFGAMTDPELLRAAQDFSVFTYLVPEADPIKSKKLFSFKIDDDGLEQLRERPKIFLLVGVLSLLNSLFDMQGYSEYRQYEKATQTLREL